MFLDHGNRLFALSLTTLALCALMLAGLHVDLTYASPDILYVDPPLTEVAVSTDFTVEIRIEETADLYGYDFHLFWTGLLTCVQCQVTPPWTPNIILKNEYDNVEMYCWCAASAMVPAIPFTGATTLARLTFHCEGYGDSTLSLQQSSLYDASGIPRPHSVENGLVSQRVRDVAVIDISSSKTAVADGFPVEVSVIVENQGDIVETFDVNVYAGDVWIGLHTEYDLPVGEIIVFTLTWNTAGFVHGNYAMRAVAENVPDETDTEDNTLTYGRVKVSILGDVTEDERLCVDMEDIALIIDWFMANQPNWDPNCDTNNDMSVDMADISNAIEHFMEAEP